MNSYSIKLWLHKIKKVLIPIRGSNNKITNSSKNYKLKFDIIGDNNKVIIKNARIHNTTIYIRGNNHELTIIDGCYIKNSKICMENDDCEIRVGSKTSIEGAEMDIKENGTKLLIGNNCMLSNGIYITVSDSHSICAINNNLRINAAKSVSIGNNVWVGKRAMILKGSTIRDNSIIAAGSIIIGQVGENSIYAGRKAEKVKEGVYWLRKRI